MPTDETNGLYGPEGSLARFTRAAKGVNEIAEKLREQSTENRARLVREALEAVARECPDPAVCDHLHGLAQFGHVETLAKLGRLLK